MRHRILITVSTVVVFLLAAFVSFVWLTRVRYVYVKVANDGAENGIYEYAKKTLDENFEGKSFVFVDKNEIETVLRKNPYVEIVSLKKVFPDKIEVELSERKECFSVYDGDKYYFLDNKYHLLRIGAERGGETVTEISLTEVDLDMSSAALGQTVGNKGQNLFTYMTSIYDGLTYAPTIINGIEIDGRRERIYFYTRTGVTMSFRFWTYNSADRIATARIICDSVKEVEEKYNSCSEYQKKNGFILSLRKDSGEGLEDKATVYWDGTEN